MTGTQTAWNSNTEADIEHSIFDSDSEDLKTQSAQDSDTSFDRESSLDHESEAEEDELDRFFRWANY